ncbi:Disks large 4 [Goodea atripinnis]|uniref:Disks large 4 n=1 Tax=Goodea atripinnis TaxID=208336 RepID=A0ABV0MV45_9TELE
MEACQADAADGVKGRAEKLLNIFQSDLFQALLDIQEFYELTVCESQTSSRPHTPGQVRTPTHSVIHMATPLSVT